MFTGIVEELGRVHAVREVGGGAHLEIDAPRVAEGLEVGGSVAVDGACLTATEVAGGRFGADAVTETLRRTALGALASGDLVNLERPLRAGAALDGHLVQGHVDAVGTLVGRSAHDDGSHDVRVAAPSDTLRYVVVKGSVAVDGVSLTVVDVLDDGFTVAIVPHTAASTTLGHKQPGSAVNLEVDLVAKYVERFVAPHR